MWKDRGCIDLFFPQNVNILRNAKKMLKIGNRIGLLRKKFVFRMVHDGLKSGLTCK